MNYIVKQNTAIHKSFTLFAKETGQSGGSVTLSAPAARLRSARGLC